MKKWTFLELAEKVLEEKRNPLNSQEIWEAAIKQGYVQNVDARGNSPWKALESLIFLNINNEKAASPFSALESGKFALRVLEQNDKRVGINEVSTPISRDKKFEFKEKDLHKKLESFCKSHFNAELKTIEHLKSGKKMFLKWSHPDMVGFYVPFDEWEKPVIVLSTYIHVPIKLFSF